MQLPADVPSQFILYAAIFRLAVTGTGVACIVFGYRLFAKASARKSSADGALVASAGKTHLELKNLAPGTMFAAFGMLIVGIMLYQGMPEFSQKKGDDSVVLRGSAPTAPADIATLTDRARTLEQAGDLSAATEAYEKAVDEVATPANSLAALYLQQNHNAEALGLARFAADVRPFRADILDTLAWAYARNDERDAALKTASRAAQLDSKYTAHLEALRRGERR